MAKQTAIVGQLGEAIVAEWLQAQGWEVLAHRWHCRWGEIDLIVRSGALPGGAIPQGRCDGDADGVNPMPNQPTVAFVEVKTRQQGNWDANGLLAITRQKQAKLWKAAQSFLADAPHLANLACRFDVALITYGPASQWQSASLSVRGKGAIALGQPVYRDGYRLTLATYLPHAFEGLEV